MIAKGKIGPVISLKEVCRGWTAQKADIESIRATLRR
jgi:hypothetical protein